MCISDKYSDLLSCIEKARLASPIAANKVRLLAASKMQSTEAIEKAIEAGIDCFGENRVQEAQEKWSELRKKHSNIELHLIGHLQTNKVKQALMLFDVIQTLDRVKLAEVLSSELRVLRNNNPQHSALKTHHFYIQINTGEESQKSGVFPENADNFIEYCDSLGLPVIGLMCIPPADQPPAPHFALLREIAMRNGIKELSMGMSSDYQEAVRMGATCVRIGSLLFGER